MDDGFCAEVLLEPASSAYFFSHSALVPPLKNLKNGRLWCFCKIRNSSEARNCGHFCSRGLKQNVVQWLHFKRILINGRWDLRQGIFGDCEFGLLFWPFCLGPPFEEFQKMADYAVFAKLATARNCGHFCSRSLKQNVVQWLHFKRILINGRWDLRRGVFWACEFGLLFRPFCFGLPFEEFKKMDDFGVFAKLAIARNCGHFCSRGLRQNVVQWYCTLSAY